MKQKHLEAFMDMAVRFGQTSTATRLKVGSVVVKNGAIIALGCNGQPPGWHTEQCEDEDGRTLPTVRHSEEAALSKLYLSTETAEGAVMFISHSPCLMCALKIVAAKIQTVYYKHPYRMTDGVEYLRSKGVEVIRLGNEKEDCSETSNQICSCGNSRTFSSLLDDKNSQAYWDRAARDAINVSSWKAYSP